MSKAHSDTRNTFVRNYLLEAICLGDFKESELKILFWLIRNTYGYRTKKGGPQRDRVRVSYEEIAEGTSQHEKTVGKALRSLEKKNVVLAYEKPTRRNGSPGIFGINSDDESWSFGNRAVPKREQSFGNRATPKNPNLLGTERFPKDAFAIPKSVICDSQKIEKNVATTPLAADGLHSKHYTVNITQDGEPLGRDEKVTWLGNQIFTKINARYFKMTGAPANGHTSCLNYATFCVDDIERGISAINEAFGRLAIWEAENGRKANKPFDSLNDAAFFFEHGWTPEKPSQAKRTVKYYRGDDEDDGPDDPPRPFPINPH